MEIDSGHSITAMSYTQKNEVKNSAASQEQKVDFLLKKIGYSASKTGVAEDESTIGLSTNTEKTI